METTCPTCGGPAKRSRHAGHVRLFILVSIPLRRQQERPGTFSSEKVNAMCPVDKYIGGAEHAAMHPLYARFITKALRDMGYLDFGFVVSSLVHQGTILGSDGQKMSKSRGNTISPDDYISKYGSDAFRLYLGFGFAYTEGGPWSDDGLKAIIRFINRVEAFVDGLPKLLSASHAKDVGPAENDLRYAQHYAIKHVTIDGERFQFNTSIARLMELLNALQKYATSTNTQREHIT